MPTSLTSVSNEPDAYRVLGPQGGLSSGMSWGAAMYHAKSKARAHPGQGFVVVRAQVAVVYLPSPLQESPARAACEGKKRFPTERACRVATALARKPETKALKPYRCPWCDGWHLGNSQ